MSPKKKAVPKKEASSSESDSDTDSSSEEEAKPKVKAKAKPKKTPDRAEQKDDEEKPEKEAKKEADDDGDDDEDEEETKKEEVKKPVFQPPPRPVFKPHTDYPPITKAEELIYCPICGLPPDFCQYGPSWDKCKPVAMEKFPQYYPELCSAENLDEAKKKADEANEKSKVKELPGGKKKREASPGITIKKLTRGGRKCVTSVAGLEGFGVKLDNAAKLFKKKFSCGASVVKGDAGQPDTVDVQGDFEDEVVDLIVDEFKLPRAKVVLLEGGTKKKGKSGR